MKDKTVIEVRRCLGVGTKGDKERERTTSVVIEENQCFNASNFIPLYPLLSGGHHSSTTAHCLLLTID